MQWSYAKLYDPTWPLGFILPSGDRGDALATASLLDGLGDYAKNIDEDSDSEWADLLDEFRPEKIGLADDGVQDEHLFRFVRLGACLGFATELGERAVGATRPGLLEVHFWGSRFLLTEGVGNKSDGLELIVDYVSYAAFHVGHTNGASLEMVRQTVRENRSELLGSYGQ